MLCPFCNNETANNAAFCDKCGAMIENSRDSRKNHSEPSVNYGSDSANAPQGTQNRMVKNGLIFGILSIFCLGEIGGILGIIFSIIGKNQLRKQNLPTGAATPGLVLSIIGIVLWTIIGIVMLIVILPIYMEMLQDILNSI